MATQKKKPKLPDAVEFLRNRKIDYTEVQISHDKTIYYVDSLSISKKYKFDKDLSNIVCNDVWVDWENTAPINFKYFPKSKNIHIRNVNNIKNIKTYNFSENFAKFHVRIQIGAEMKKRIGVAKTVKLIYGIDPEPDGSFLFYKKAWKIKNTPNKFKSHYDKKYIYTLGQVAKPKYKYDPDPLGDCRSGLHVSSVDYSFSGNVRLVCKVFPTDIISICSDKVRCKQITPIKVHTKK